MKLSTVLAASVLCYSLTTQPAHPQSFAAVVTPPRLELQTRPGKTSRQIIDIQHVGRETGQYRIYTNDWRYGQDGTVLFQDELTENSCRPWVSIERNELTLATGKLFRFRFEVSPPPDSGPIECRFALMIEGRDPGYLNSGRVQVPVGGRIAVIVYVQVGDTAPHLELVGSRVAKVNGRTFPILEIHNKGNAHGRLEGFLEGKDASGTEMEMSPADGPVLPGETRAIQIAPVVQDGSSSPEIRYPLTVTGMLEWSKGKLPINLRFIP